MKLKIQELSYRQQIARKLHTQYAEGILRVKCYTVTLKSRLKITQGHWIQNSWIDLIHLIQSYRSICDIYDFFAPYTNVLTYLLLLTLYHIT